MFASRLSGQGLVAAIALLAFAPDEGWSQAIGMEDGPIALQEYAIADLEAAMPASRLIQLLTTVIEPESWRGGGACAILPLPPDKPARLAIAQHPAAHRRIAALLERLRQAAREKPSAGSVPPGETAENEMGRSEAERKIAAALQSGVWFEFYDMSLGDLVEYLKTNQDIDMYLDLRALERARISPEVAVSRSPRGAPLGSSLRQALAELGLAYVVENDAVVITTSAEACRRFQVRLYSVDALIGSRGGRPSAADCEALIDTLVRAVSPGSWRRAGGAGTIAAFTCGSTRGLAVAQSPMVQRQVADLLEQLRGTAQYGVPPRVGQRQARNSLNNPADLEFTHTKLSEVLGYLRGYHGVEVQWDKPSLLRAGVDPETPVNVKLSFVKLRTALRLMLRDAGLTYIIEDGIVRVVLPEEAESWQSTVAYPVTELLSGEARGRASGEALAQVLVAAIAPGSWRQNGGRGHALVYSPGARAAAASTNAGPVFLVVTQSSAVHEQVEEFLDALRCANVCGRPGSGCEPAGDPPQGPRSARRPADALRAPANVAIARSALDEALDALRDERNVRIHVDRQALRNERISTDSMVTSMAGGAPLRETLDRILADSKLTYVVRDEVLLITTPREAGHWLFTAVYALDASTKQRIAGGSGSADTLQVIARLTASVAPRSWTSSGGRARIVPITLGGGDALVVTQTYAVQEQLADLLGRPTICQNAVAWREPGR